MAAQKHRGRREVRTISTQEQPCHGREVTRGRWRKSPLWRWHVLIDQNRTPVGFDKHQARWPARRFIGARRQRESTAL